MAKREPTLTVEEMERELGYEVASLDYPDDGIRRFYSDLRPVSPSVYERTRREFDEYERQKSQPELGASLDNLLPTCGHPQILQYGKDTVTITCWNHVTRYCFTVDIHQDFGLDLHLVFTRNEVLGAMATAKLPPDAIGNIGPMFLKLPREIRDKIYALALPEIIWGAGRVEASRGIYFCEGIGDPSGFYYPISSLAVLRLSRELRQEMLPIAYRNTHFHFDDMDDLTKLLISVGEIGRANIESLKLGWKSRSDSECQWADATDPSEHCLTLPTLHVERCIQLVKQCRRLKFLRLCFESDLILGMCPDMAYKNDASMCMLRSIQGIEMVEIWDLSNQPLEHRGFAEWLKEGMESPKASRDHELRMISG